MDVFALIAEDKIRTAMKDGEFDHLPGKGKPLKLEDLSSLPEDLRLSYKVLKNAGLIPDEKKNKELLSVNDLIKCCDEEAVAESKQLTKKSLHYDGLADERHWSQSPAFKKYADKLRNKLR
ncbi:DUF1992 domain-containing protein [Camelliibacillus cellulosilyticus]|uniref:DUF1992 domain-containing protein n=1 Tax=Camelliibacillus cellulosilyticus TaxID=2174486 RepID=A0ABV9GN30_9BACL